jgi:activator of 2-hydroxyglutaryl-CoA dehydratase
VKVIIGIDVGGSTTKIVGMKKDAENNINIIAPQLVRATDAVT